MRRGILLFIISGLILFNLSCFKSKEEIARDKKEANSLIKHADKLFFENKFVEALSIYDESLKIYDFKDGIIYYKLAFCYDKGVKDYKKAEKYYDKSIETLSLQLDKTKVKYLAADYFNLGIIALKQGDVAKKNKYFAKAIPLLKEILNNGNADGLDLFRIGYYYFDLQNYDEAIKYFLKAAKALKKENPFHFYYAGAYFNIGIIYWKQEDINTALYYWKLALKIEPNNETYKEWYNKALLIKQASS